MRDPRKQIIDLIDELRSLDALFYVAWSADDTYPRFWLREWCGFKGWVSMGTAESVRDMIWDGRLVAPKAQAKAPEMVVNVRPIKRSAPRLEVGKTQASCAVAVIETHFVR